MNIEQEMIRLCFDITVNLNLNEPVQFRRYKQPLKCWWTYFFSELRDFGRHISFITKKHNKPSIKDQSVCYFQTDADFATFFIILFPTFKVLLLFCRPLCGYFIVTL